MYGMQPNAYAQYGSYPGYQAYGQPAAAVAAIAPGGTPQQVSRNVTSRAPRDRVADDLNPLTIDLFLSLQAAYWQTQQGAGQWGAYYGGQPGQSS